MITSLHYVLALSCLSVLVYHSVHLCLQSVKTRLTGGKEKCFPIGLREFKNMVTLYARCTQINMNHCYSGIILDDLLWDFQSIIN